MKRFLGTVLAVVLIITGIGLYNYWVESRPYPSWQVVKRDDISGNYHYYELKLEGRSRQQYTPTLSLICENGVLKVQMFVGLVERIGGGLGSASLPVSEYYVVDPKGSMTGTQQGWVVPEGSVTLERWDQAPFIRQLASAPWFVAITNIESRFHVEGLNGHLAELGQRCDLTTEAASP